MRTAFARWMEEYASRNPQALLLTGDLGFSVFDEFRLKHPGCFLNVGVAESALIGMAAGAAMTGRRVLAYSIATFLTYRVLEQVRIDLCYQKLPVCLVGSGGGLSYADAGATHHSTEDLAIMSSLPGINVFAPGDPFEVTAILDLAIGSDKPSYVRLGRSKDPAVHRERPPLEIGKAFRIRDGVDVSILAIGNMLSTAVDVGERLSRRSVSAAVTSIPSLKPFDEEYVRREATHSKLLVTLEEHVRAGGLLSHAALALSSLPKYVPLLGFTTPDVFAHIAGSQAYLRRLYGLDPESIEQRILEVFAGGRPR